MGFGSYLLAEYLEMFCVVIQDHDLLPSAAGGAPVPAGCCGLVDGLERLSLVAFFIWVRATFPTPPHHDQLMSLGWKALCRSRP